MNLPTALLLGAASCAAALALGYFIGRRRSGSRPASPEGDKARSRNSAERDAGAPETAEQQLRAADAARSTRLEALRLMAGWLSHAIGNLVTVMNGNIYLAQQAPGLSPQAAAKLQEVEKIVERTCDLMMQLKAFAKGTPPRKRHTELTPLVREGARAAVANTAVQIDDRLAADLWAVEGDPAQLTQVVTTVVLNAVQAMGGKGRVALTSRNLPPGTGVGLPPADRWVQLTISDAGPGIAPEVLPRIFDPFFSTKEGGAGLGLAMAHGIVERHQGRLRVETRAGAGTTMELLLPAAATTGPAA